MLTVIFLTEILPCLSCLYSGVHDISVGTKVGGFKLYFLPTEFSPKVWSFDVFGLSKGPFVYILNVC